MSDFSMAWELTRGRFINEIKDLNQEQLNWRLHPGALTIGEGAIHVAGVEIYFASQIRDETPDGLAARIARSGVDGVVNDSPFPFTPEEITPELVMEALEIGRSLVEPVITNPTEEIRTHPVKSALGPMIDGAGAFARLDYHAGYHQGQTHLIKIAPGFPK